MSRRYPAHPGRFAVDPWEPCKVLDAQNPGVTCGFLFPETAASSAEMFNRGEADHTGYGWVDAEGNIVKAKP